MIPFPAIVLVSAILLIFSFAILVVYLEEKIKAFLFVSLVGFFLSLLGFVWVSLASSQSPELVKSTFHEVTSQFAVEDDGRVLQFFICDGKITNVASVLNCGVASGYMLKRHIYEKSYLGLDFSSSSSVQDKFDVIKISVSHKKPES